MPSSSPSEQLPALTSAKPKTLAPAGDTWRALIDRLSERMARPKAPPRRRLQDTLNAAELLLSDSGDAEGLRIASALAEVVRKLDDAQLLEFFVCLANKFGPDEAALRSSARTRRRSGPPPRPMRTTPARRTPRSCARPPSRAARSCCAG
jgi:hypothetical protein